MKFEYLELVEVRDKDDEMWERCVYLGSIPSPKCVLHLTMSGRENELNFDGIPLPWEQIRKIEEK